MNPPTAGPLDPITEGQPACCGHDAADHPDQPTITTAAEPARLGEPRSGIEEFLRCGDGGAEPLVDLPAGHRGHRHPATVIDAVRGAGPGPRRRPGTGGHHRAGRA